MDIYERLNKMDKRYRRYHWFVMRAFVRTVRRHLTGRRAKRILDVGTGTGTAAIRIRELLPGSLVCGLDKNELLIRLASEKSGASQRGYFLVGDVEKLPFREDVFDCVMGKVTLCYWNKPLEGLAEIKRVMKKDAVGIFLEQNPRSLVARLYSALRIGNFVFLGLPKDKSFGAVFSPAFSLGISYVPKSLRQMLQQTGANYISIKKRLWGSFFLIVFDFSPQKS